MNKQLLIFILLFAISISPMHAYSVNNSNDTHIVINIGGEMSDVIYMLEAYVLIGTEITYSAPEESLKTSMRRYEDLLKRLERDYPLDDKILADIEKSRKAWAVIKNALMTAFTDTDKDTMRKNAVYIHDNTRTVVMSLSHIKKHLLSKFDTKNSELVNAAIDVGTSARRLSVHYVMDMWKLDDPTIYKHWNKAMKRYKTALDILGESKLIQQPEYQALYSECQDEYYFFSMVSKFKNSYMPTLTHKKAESAFNSAQNLAALLLVN